MTITLTPELEAALAQAAKRLGKTPEELAEETLRARLRPSAASVHEYPPGTNLADLFASRIGLIDSSETGAIKPSHLAEHTGQEFGKMLAEKHAKRVSKE